MERKRDRKYTEVKGNNRMRRGNVKVALQRLNEKIYNTLIPAPEDFAKLFSFPSHSTLYTHSLWESIAESEWFSFLAKVRLKIQTRGSSKRVQKLFHVHNQWSNGQNDQNGHWDKIQDKERNPTRPMTLVRKGEGKMAKREWMNICYFSNCTIHMDTGQNFVHSQATFSDCQMYQVSRMAWK